jgi:hypothetical protein
VAAVAVAVAATVAEGMAVTTVAVEGTGAPLPVGGMAAAHPPGEAGGAGPAPGLAAAALPAPLAARGAARGGGRGMTRVTAVGIGTPRGRGRGAPSGTTDPRLPRVAPPGLLATMRSGGSATGALECAQVVFL